MYFRQSIIDDVWNFYLISPDKTLVDTLRKESMLYSSFYISLTLNRNVLHMSIHRKLSERDNFLKYYAKKITTYESYGLIPIG